MILLIDKPQGITSFDCIRILRRKLGVTKMGHAGTLDPMATGLMIIGVGGGTKKLQEFLKLDKTYEADILLGVRTETGDITGRELPISNNQFPDNNQISKISNQVIRRVFNEMVGKLELPVPAYSAVKRGGEPLYKKARRGEKVTPPVKTMVVHSAQLLDVTTLSKIENSHDRSYFLEHGEMVVRVKLDVGSGTYIRSLAEEFGRRLDVPTTLAGLRRTRIGEFKVKNAQKLPPLC